MKRKILSVLSVIAAAVLLTLLCSCQNVLENTVHSVAGMQGKNVGVIAGTAAEESVVKSGITENVKTYYDTDTLLEDVLSGALDCAVLDRSTAEALTGKDRRVKTLKEAFSDQGYRIAVSKGNAPMLKLLNDALRTLEIDGTLENIRNGWLGSGSYSYTSGGSASDDTVIIAVSPGVPPFEYYDGETLKGLEIDVLRAVCDRIGVSAEIYETDSERMIYLTESGKVNFSIGRITETDSDLIDYSETYVTAEQLVLVRNSK